MNNATERLSAALAGRYRIERALGQGGMATVYLAEDLKHKRKVAIKVLKPELAAVLGAERFVQEITTTAALSHPHILPLFDSGEADGFLYYVMPLVDGETLRAKLDRETQLGVDEAVKLASEVADALHYAHEHGVIHRDIKPENILLANGRPMVADFGIALAVSAAAGGRMTETGLSLGTPHYMSPEQATAEKEITRRSDVYSLASVLYEMLSGSPPHTGSSAQQIIMKIITEQPAQVTAIRKSVPAHVAAVLAKALEKLPADRFDTADSFAKALADKSFATSTAGAAYGASTAGLRGGGTHSLTALRVAIGVAVLSTSAAAALAFWPDPAPEVRRLVVDFPRGITVQLGLQDFRRFLPTRDGKHFVIVDSTSQLAVRGRDEESFRPLVGTLGAIHPFESPDGRSIGFLAVTGGTIRTVPLDGGPVVLVTRGEAAVFGATWSEDGYIYATSQVSDSIGIVRFPANGGEPSEQVTQEEGGLATHVFPVALPDGRGILFTLQPFVNQTNSQIAVTVPGSGTFKALTRGVHARYLATGHLLVLTYDGTIVAVPFDLDKLELTGSPVPVVSGVVPPVPWGGDGEFHVTDEGTLFYERGMRQVDLDPVWVTRAGVESPAVSGWRGNLGAFAISPDGRRVAYSDNQGALTRLWIAPLDGRGAPTLFESGGTQNVRPSWSADGRSLAWISNRRGNSEAFVRGVDRQETAQRLTGDFSALGVWEVRFASRGPWVLYRDNSSAGNLYAFRPGIDSVPVPLLTTSAQERQPVLSPDGRWLAYISNADGFSNVYVRPFPNINDAVWQVTTEGATSPGWSRDGRELFYLLSGGTASGGAVSEAMMAVQVQAGETFAWGRAERLFATQQYRSASNSMWWDQSPIDGRFLMFKKPSVGDLLPDIMMVENFFTELRAKVRR